MAKKNTSLEISKVYDGRFDEVSAAVIVVLPPNGQIVSLNVEAEELTGYEANELKKIKFYNIFSEDEQERIKKLFSGLKGHEKRPGKLFEHNVIVQKRSKRKIIVDMGFRLGQCNGEPVFIFTLQDITNLKNSEARISQANDYVTNILNSMKESVFVIDSSKKIKTANESALKLLELNESDLVGQSINNIFDTAHFEPEYLTTPGSSSEFEAVFKTRALEKLPVLVSISNLQTPMGGSPLYVVGAVDLTERKKAEKMIAEQQMMLVQATKMSSLGVMASGIAHEINNPLHVIIGRCEILEMNGPDAPIDQTAIRDSITVISKMAQRISNIVGGLKNFSRDNRDEPLEPNSFRAVIEESLLLCETRIRNAGINLQIPDKSLDFSVLSRPTQLSQVIVNLLNNAYDAIQDNPLLSADAKFIKLELNENKNFVCMSVTNGGEKIKEEIATKIFNPFFTTKAVGKGTGLGLSISRSIIESHGGKINVDWDHEFTRFIIEIPKAKAKKLKLAS